MFGIHATPVVMGCLALALGAGSLATAQPSEPKPEPAARRDADPPELPEGPTEGLAGLSRLGTMVPQTPITILLAPAVQSELNLTEKQKAQASDLALSSTQKQRDLYRNVLSSPENLPEALIGARNELRQENEQAIVGILEPRQAHRLNQIILQFEGPLAVSRSEIAHKLRLSETQNDYIQGIMLELQEQQRALYAEARRRAVTLSQLDPSRFGQVRSEMAKLRDRAVQRIAKVLDRKQKLAFNKMLGAQFDLGKLNLEGSAPESKASSDSKASGKASPSKSEAKQDPAPATDETKVPSQAKRRKTRSKTR